jgi:hypothetical protein
MKTNLSPTNLRSVLLAASALTAACTVPAADTATNALRVYFIGNSVTDTVRYGSLAKLAASRGHQLVWGRQMIPGAPLQWLWDHPSDGFTEKPFGYPREAFTHFPWDFVSLQPFDRGLASKDGSDDVTKIRQYAEMAAARSPDVQIYLYARWPRITSGGKALKFDKNDYDPTQPGSGADLSKVDPFERIWLSRYTGGYDGSNESRDYFDRLLVESRQATSFLKKPLLLVPVGHAMHALDQRMRAGEVPGYSDIHQLYKDGIHLNETGSYLVGCAFFATLFREDPAGLPTEPYGKITPAAAKDIHETVWKVVREHPESGVKRP